MSKSLINKVFEQTNVRVIVDGGDPDRPMFVASDVASALGYERPNDAINQHCNGTAFHRTVHDRLGRLQEMRVIYEPDVYRLIFGSKLVSS